jgi:hypothetical protein
VICRQPADPVERLEFVVADRRLRAGHRLGNLQFQSNIGGRNTIVQTAVRGNLQRQATTTSAAPATPSPATARRSAPGSDSPYESRTTAPRPGGAPPASAVLLANAGPPAAVQPRMTSPEAEALDGPSCPNVPEGLRRSKTEYEREGRIEVAQFAQG